LIRSAFRPANILWITGGITRTCRYSNKNKQQPMVTRTRTAQMGSHEHSLLSNMQNIIRLTNKAEVRMKFTVIYCSKCLLLQYSQMYYTGTNMYWYLSGTGSLHTSRYGTYLALKLLGNFKYKFREKVKIKFPNIMLLIHVF
jgi:hypothetical protein